VFKATEQIIPLFGENEKVCPQNEGKSIPEILSHNFPRGACPQNPLAAWALWAQVTRPNYPLAVTPVTTKATAVLNSIENPDYPIYS